MEKGREGGRERGVDRTRIASKEGVRGGKREGGARKFGTPLRYPREGRERGGKEGNIAPGGT